MLFCMTFSSFAQQDAWVYFTDKQIAIYPLNNPSTFLSQKSIDRKNAHNVSIDTSDIPVNETYISQLKTTAGITVMAKSKWFNAVHVRGSQTDINNLINQFSFINQIVFADKSLNAAKKSKEKQENKFSETLINFVYGNAANQVEMINADKLHLANYTGSGMTVAILDGGFPNVHTMTSFNRLRNTNTSDASRILGTYDFVNRDINVYTNTTSNHGTLVLSTMAGFVQNQYVGTAPDAFYYLFNTEYGPTENPVEESYWVEAAERADSLGVDVINTSLGYKDYDNPNYNYLNSDLNGLTAYITKGANIAFEKGMLLVNSAGNSGSGGLNAPADSANVFTIGAVNSLGNYAPFSSIGSSFQPTQKPDVVAKGQGSAVINENDVITNLSGTSFSSPIMAGGIVCLWQALPNKSNAEIIQLVRESASQYNNPDYFLGYGIPNLEIALTLGLGKFYSDVLKIYPNPATIQIQIDLGINEMVTVSIFDVFGKRVVDTTVKISNPSVDISSLSKGVYIVKLQSAINSKTIKLIKQ